MKLIAKHKDRTFVIKEDLPDIGFNLYVYNSENKCTHDYLQDTLQLTREFAFEEFGVPIDSWTEKAYY